LNLVSLATLPQGKDRFLIESGPTLHYLSAERDLVLPPARDPRGRGLLAMGGPDFDAAPDVPSSRAASPLPAGSSGPAPAGPEPTLQTAATRGSVYRSPPASCSDFRTLRFDPLPGAASEVTQIESLWSRGPGRRAAPKDATLILTGAAAGEAAFKRNAGGYRVLHLATHGFFLQDRCDTAPGLGRGSSGDAPGSLAADRPPAGDNPLALSGLALAGANRRRDSAGDPDAEDGILTAEEIASLDLTGVESLVLSGCDTGTGKVVTGEGVLGLRRAFQIAGARTLVMSLWKVEDASTIEWMRRLYEARGEGLSTADSVQKAGLETLRARRSRGKSTHPFTWGAFVAAGDWR
jgi:CHAT domain-containing protein